MENGILLRKILSRHWHDMLPLEVKIFVTLYWLADPDTGELSISLQRLSDKLHVPINELIVQLGKLLLHGLISFKSDENPKFDSHFKILFENKTQDMHTQDDFFANVGEGSNETKAYVNDNVINKNNISLNVNDTVNVTGAEKKSKTYPQIEGENLTATHIAHALGDEQNLHLYEAYLNRYSTDVILKAYHQVLKTPRHRIRKSLGAYFTFLVKKYGGKNQ